MMNDKSSRVLVDEEALARMAACHREQLSALIDGELDPDQARFLVRRLEHDHALSGCQERWQVAGDVLRGQLGAIAPSGFADRVALAMTQDRQRVASAPRHRRQWAWGGALVAGLAVLSLWPRLPTDSGVTPVPPVVAVVPEPEPATVPVPVIEPAAVAVPVRQRVPVEATSVATVASVMAPEQVLPVATADAAVSPFAPFAAVEPVARPWPRSALNGDGRFSVRLSGSAVSPFDPAVAADHLPSDGIVPLHQP